MTKIIQSQIVLVDDLASYEEELRRNYRQDKLKIFFREDFLIEDAKEVIREAYIAESEPKIIALGAKVFSAQSQNSLLKIIEEPPRNIIFLIAVNAKSALLATIRSRLPIENKKAKRQRIATGLIYKNLDLKQIYNFLQQHKNIEKNDLKELIEQITIETLEQGLRFSEEELNLFEKLLQLSLLHSRAQNLLSVLMLSIYNRTYK